VITQPLFFEVHRLSEFSPRSLDVDVVLDLMIHDIDIILTLTGQPPEDIRAAGIHILSEKVDIANVRMQFPGGCVANLTASRVSTERVRKLRFFQPQQYISLDYGRRDVLVLAVGGGKQDAAVPSINSQISMVKPDVGSEEPLRAELRAFLDCVRTRSQPLVTLEAGRSALAIALKIVDAIQAHSNRVQLDRLKP